MAYPKEMRDRVRRAYVFDGLSLDLAAIKCGVACPTAQRWKAVAKQQGDDWDKVRAAHTLAGGGLDELGRGMITSLLVQFQTTMDELQLTDGSKEELAPAERVKLLVSLTDALNKTVASSKRLLPETSQLATALEVIQQLSRFIAERFPQHLQAFADVLEPFGAELEAKYGS